MKKVRMAVALMFCAFAHSSLAAEQPLVPTPLAGAPNFEIGDLLYRLMQPEGSVSIPWSHLANSGIVWITDGYETQDDTAFRAGVFRANVLGEVSTELKQNLMELPWRITYATFAAPKFGAQMAYIKPGPSEQSECFGSSYTGCSFNLLPSLRQSAADVEVICQSDSYRSPSVYRLSARNKSPLMVVVVTDGGSGGDQSEVYAFTQSEKTDKELCEPA